MGQTACNQILCTTAKQKSLNDDDLSDPSSSSNQISSLYFRNKLHFCVATIVYKSRPRRFSFQNKLQLAFLQLLPFLLHSLLLISRCFSIFLLPSFFSWTANNNRTMQNTFLIGTRDNKSWLRRRDGQFLWSLNGTAGLAQLNSEFLKITPLLHLLLASHKVVLL